MAPSGRSIAQPDTRRLLDDDERRSLITRYGALILGELAEAAGKANALWALAADHLESANYEEALKAYTALEVLLEHSIRREVVDSLVVVRAFTKQLGTHLDARGIGSDPPGRRAPP